MQYNVPAGMSTQQYLATPAGRAQTQAANSLFSQGAWGGPGRAQPQQNPYATATPYGRQQASSLGNYANMPASQRPPAFQQSMQTPFGAMSPSQYYPQRDAFISGANSQMGSLMQNAGVYTGPGAPPATWGQAPQFNPYQLWNQAGTMVQQGWQNPFAAPSPNIVSRVSSQAPQQESGGQFQDLFSQFNFTPPPGFMDALIGRLQGQGSAGASQPYGSGATAVEPGSYEDYLQQYRSGQFRGPMAGPATMAKKNTGRPWDEEFFNKQKNKYDPGFTSLADTDHTIFANSTAYAFDRTKYFTEKVSQDPQFQEWVAAGRPGYSDAAAAIGFDPAKEWFPGVVSYSSMQAQVLAAKAWVGSAEAKELISAGVKRKRQQDKEIRKGREEYRKPASTPRPATPPSQPAAGPMVAPRLPGPMSMAEAAAQGWQRQPDGSYARPGAHLSTIPGRPRRQPQTINWGSMTPQELAGVKSPYLGGKWPTVTHWGSG